MAERPKSGKDDSNLLDTFLGWVKEPDSSTTESEKEKKKARPSEPQPSLETIGMTKCSVCGKEVSVMLTRKRHPFTSCGRCGARTFYNSAVAIALLKKRLRKVRL